MWWKCWCVCVLCIPTGPCYKTLDRTQTAGHIAPHAWITHSSEKWSTSERSQEKQRDVTDHTQPEARLKTKHLGRCIQTVLSNHSVWSNTTQMRIQSKHPSCWCIVIVFDPTWRLSVHKTRDLWSNTSLTTFVTGWITNPSFCVQQSPLWITQSQVASTTHLGVSLSTSHAFATSLHAPTVGLKSTVKLFFETKCLKLLLNFRKRSNTPAHTTFRGACAELIYLN